MILPLHPLIFLLPLLSAHQAVAEQNSSDRLFINGEIYTVNPDQPWAEAIHVRNGEIAYVGDNETALSHAKHRTEIIDLGGNMMLPGLHDVHVHPLEAMSPLFPEICELSNKETDAENFIYTLIDCGKNPIGNAWIRGFGHSVFTLLEADRSPVEILDDAIPDRPAVFMEETSHSVWVNSLALKMAGIDKNTPNPPGGVIVKNPTTGKPTGILFDAAGDFVLNKAWASNKTIRHLNYLGLLAGLEELNSYGITSAVEARTYWRANMHEAWLLAEERDELTVRAILNLWAYPSHKDAIQIDALKKLYRNNENDLLRLSQIKIYSDGIVINTTAAMSEPYLETLGDIPSNNGLNYFSEQRLARYIAELGNVGFDFHIHALGDRATRESLNAIEVSQHNNARHRLTHLEYVKPEDFPRFKTLNVTADMQVAGEFAQPQHWYKMRHLVGHRTHPTIPLKDLYNAGARITLSSDWNVSTLNPFIGMQNALTRTPQNLPDLDSIIRAYTINGAYVMRQEHLTGSLEVGKQADFVVIDQNLFDIPENQISQTEVIMTVLAGDTVYQGTIQ